MKEKLLRLFTEHPATQNETYGQHAWFAWSVAVHLFFSAVFLTIHAIFPFICPPKPFDIKSTKKFIDSKCECRK